MDDVTTYGALLQDPRWQSRRLQIIARDGDHCTRCASQVELEVHHRRYFYGRKPWEYEDEYLQTLCDPCHRLETLHPGQYEAPRKDEGLVHIAGPLSTVLGDIIKMYKKDAGEEAAAPTMEVRP